MARTDDAPGMFSFFGNDPGGYGAMDMRRRIALQMMSDNRRKGYPKNIGEGLASIGDSLGEIGMMRAMLAAQARQDASSKATAEKIYGPGTTGAPATGSPPATTPPVRTSSTDPAVTEPAPVETPSVETPPVDTAAIPAAPSMGPDTAHFTPQNEPLITAPPTAAAAIGSDAGSRLPATFAERFDAVNPPPPQQAEAVPLVTAKEQPAAVLAPKAMAGELEGGVETGPDHAPAFAKTSRIPIAPDATSTTGPRADASVSQKVVDSESAPIDDRLMGAIQKIESGGNPNARTGSYKGLYQLSDEQFAKYGGHGSIYDPAENTRVAKLVMADEAKNLSKALGRPVTQDEVYLAHQQGSGGAKEHLTHPERPAWQSMYATGEGQQKGEGWARKAIWGNVPDAEKRRYGSVDNITSGDFVELWKGKYNRFAGGDTQTASTSPRDSVAAKMVANNVQPPQPDEQDAVLSDVLAVREARDAAYPQTASLGREGDVQSDAPPVGGMVGPATGDAIAATAAARRNGIASKLMQQPPVAPVPQGAAPGLAQTDPRLAEANLLSPVATDVPKSVPTQRFRTANDAITPAPQVPTTAGIPQTPPQAPPQPEQLPPELRQGSPPPIPAPEPMSPREAGARRALAGEGSQDPIVRGAAELAIREETERRNRIDGMRGAQYQEDRKHYDEIARERLKWGLEKEKRDFERQKHPLEIKKAEQETQEKPIKGDDGRFYLWDRTTQTMREVTPGAQAGNPPPINTTEGQAKDLGFYQRGRRSLADLGDGQELNKFTEWHLSGLPLVGNYLSSSRFQEQWNAAREFTAVVKRRESGAAVSPSEVKEILGIYFPQPGDKPEVLAQKQFLREGQISAIRDGLGKASPLADRFDKTFDEERLRLAAAKQKAAADGKDLKVEELPPVTISSREEREALPKGRRYTRPGSTEILVKQ